MATMPSSPLQLSNAFPLASSPHKRYAHRPVLIFTTRATDPQTPPSEEEAEGEVEPSKSGTDSEQDSVPDSEQDSFENRLRQVRLRYRSGTGKKAEIRKGRKSKKAASSGSGMYLPPVPLKEPMSGGLKVDFGFNPFSERINGRIAILGLSALLMVELATGKSVINYHTPAIVLIQIYFVAAVAALYIKYEKERVSVWPESSSPKE